MQIYTTAHNRQLCGLSLSVVADKLRTLGEPLCICLPLCLTFVLRLTLCFYFVSWCGAVCVRSTILTKVINQSNQSAVCTAWLVVLFLPGRVVWLTGCRLRGSACHWPIISVGSLLPFRYLSVTVLKVNNLLRPSNLHAGNGEFCWTFGLCHKAGLFGWMVVKI